MQTSSRKLRIVQREDSFHKEILLNHDIFSIIGSFLIVNEIVNGLFLVDQKTKDFLSKSSKLTKMFKRIIPINYKKFDFILQKENIRNNYDLIIFSYVNLFDRVVKYEEQNNCKLLISSYIRKYCKNGTLLKMHILIDKTSFNFGFFIYWFERLIPNKHVYHYVKLFNLVTSSIDDNEILNEMWVYVNSKIRACRKKFNSRHAGILSSMILFDSLDI